MNFNILELVYWTTVTTHKWHTYKILLNVKLIMAQELWLLSWEIDGKPTNANLYFKLSSSTCFPVVTFWLSSCSSNAFILKLKKKIRKAMKKMVQRKSFLTACHLGKLKLAFTSPDVISTSQKGFLTNRNDFTVLLLFEFLKKHHLPAGQV